MKLTTQTFAELNASPSIGRAEALRRSMAALINNGEPHEAHPATWAPLALVGEGELLDGAEPSNPGRHISGDAAPPSRAQRHRDPRHTVHYTRVAGRRFEGLWK